ncbi:hypothetical protein GCM10011491_06390 [Brucella endophytica]|uniref:DUF2497 domain-containing protein n=1 Tax=Brucella endophytica TaxID=1963359 RepID=A0A916S3L8_9HYPH|nr:DUF2497 domain-containing protein [Brucella endophytica]GGA81767.1 hypothetical protein GCM10011491_06390 [Brucella endophytica]
MAQTSSAAREPSMEEILASIRRIIEDSDVVRQSVPPKPERPTVAPVRGEIAEFRRDPEPVLRPVQAAPRPVEAEEKREDRRTQETDEAMNALAARIGLRGTLDARGASIAPAPVQPSYPMVDEEEEPVLDPVNDDRPVKAAIPEAPMALKPAPAVAPPKRVEPVEQKRVEPMEPRPTITKAPEPVQLAQPAPEPAEPAFEEAPAPYVASEASSIISPTTGRQVAAAFEDLTTAMRVEQRRSFDEMAEKMLRPMLQEWLDNNLPSLVERLVREEIERVVRGMRG